MTGADPVHVIDAGTGDLARAYPFPNESSDFVWGLSWSPDGTKIDDGMVEVSRRLNIWDFQTGEPLLTIHQHTGQVFQQTSSPDGTRFVTGSTDGTTRIWDAATGEELLTLATPQ